MERYNLIGLFLVYSFLGWVLETVIGTIQRRHIVNRGAINGPFCVIYGFTGVLISITLRDLTGVWLFLFSAIYASVIEWIGGHMIEKLYHERWWNYSNIKWNLDGYVCLPAAVLWGALGYLTVRMGNRLLVGLFDLIPDFLFRIVIWAAAGALAADWLFSMLAVWFQGAWVDKIRRADSRFAGVSLRLSRWIAGKVEHRIHNAYPKAEAVAEQKEEAGVFAAGCSFYKIVLLFLIGAFLGDIVETIFCRITAGVWMSRSSVVWGPFSLVWGIAIAAATLLLYRYRNRSDSFLFLTGTLLGGAYEYLCSVFTEVVFGKIFWDYSGIPFNLGGRINLLYCFFWGIAAVVWFKLIYVRLSDLIEKIPVKPGKIITWCLIVFMVANMAVSSLALVRYDQRERGVEASEFWQEWMDTHYDDETMERIYPNAKSADTEEGQTKYEE